jgi:hypothetical protein
MAQTGGTLGEATARVNLAFGLALNTDLVTLNPLTDTLNGAATAPALIADAVVNDTLVLAQAAGATGDLFGKLAAVIAAASFASVHATSAATVQALGLGADAAARVASLAAAGAALLAQKLATNAGDVRSLVNDVTSLQAVQQGAEATDVQAGTAAIPLLAKYTGANLDAQVGAGSAAAAGTPFEFAWTDVTAGTIGYTHGEGYAGDTAGIAKQYVWNSGDSVAIGARSQSVFLEAGTADDALQATGGVNLLDGGAGSNFLVGSIAGTDTFSLDVSGPAPSWSTIVNFHAGDTAMLFGFQAGTSTQSLTEGEGVGSYKGLTLHAELAGAGSGVNASLTFAGIDRATADAHFTITPQTASGGASDYLLIHYNA